MKTELEIRKMLVDLEDKMQYVNSRLETVSNQFEFDLYHKERVELKAQYNILLEVLK